MSCKTNKYVILLLIAFAKLSTGCNKFIFVPDGTIINGNHQYYLNDSIKLSIYVLGDFNIYNHKLRKGVKVNKLYPQDKRALNYLDLKPSQMNLFFSAEPIIEPYYHFIALLRNSSFIDFAPYKVKYKNDTLLYYYRYLKTKKIEIAETIIPYHKSYIEFVHYNTPLNNCQYCDMDEISMVNSTRVLQGSELKFYDLLNQYNDSCKSNPISFDIPYSKVLKNKSGLIMGYKINPEQNAKELEIFKFLKPNINHIELNLCAGDYLIRYFDLNHKPIYGQHSIIK